MVTFTILYDVGEAIEYNALSYRDAVEYAKRNANGRTIILVYWYVSLLLCRYAQRGTGEKKMSTKENLQYWLYFSKIGIVVYITLCVIGKFI